MVPLAMQEATFHRITADLKALMEKKKDFDMKNKALKKKIDSNNSSIVEKTWCTVIQITNLIKAWTGDDQVIMVPTYATDLKEVTAFKVRELFEDTEKEGESSAFQIHSTLE